MARPAAANPATRPRIGIPIGVEQRGGRAYQSVSLAYAEALAAAGGLAFYLPLQTDPRALLEPLDGLLLPGGGDFTPPRPYAASVVFDPVPEDQLRFDRELLLAARERALPVLGICYGMQLIALAHGGRLHHDIPSDLPQALPHRGEAGHELQVEPDSTLARWLGAARTRVNTHHHQAVADPGPAFRAVAHAPDAVIEAIEARDGPPCLGVQWHPERSSAEPDRSLLRHFIAACSAAR